MKMFLQRTDLPPGQIHLLIISAIGGHKGACVGSRRDVFLYFKVHYTEASKEQCWKEVSA